MIPKFPKPHQVRKQVDAVKVYACGREVCADWKQWSAKNQPRVHLRKRWGHSA